MKKWFGASKPSELTARDAIRQKKWSKALEHYQSQATAQERDYALWNLVGDLHMSNKARSQAVEAWRRAIEGYVAEGLYENVLGIARKMLRRVPDEEDAYLILASAYLELEYHADCLGQVRSYVKLAKQRSESELRAQFKTILDADIRAPHLLEELLSLYEDSGIEDIELQRRVDEYVTSRLAAREAAAPASGVAQAETASAETDDPEAQSSVPFASPFGGLATLDGGSDVGEPAEFANFGRALGSSPQSEYEYSNSTPGYEAEQLPAGDGKDHYDLGIVYREMKLWDAAISEFEQARRDSALRTRATLALAECLQESGDQQGALVLLENEKKQSSGSPSERIGLDFQLGTIHELVGNLEAALECFETVQRQNAAHAEAGQKVSELSRRLGRTV
jgi:tetratricopeptide (TPR) repeat protein